MNSITRFSRLFTAVLSVVAANCFLPEAMAQTPKDRLVYQDDFSVSNSAWRFGFTATLNNQTAIAASYGKIEGGRLQLKANVGCGWDYLFSVASLEVALPEEFAIEYRLNKLNWCGNFYTRIGVTDEFEEPIPSPGYEICISGNWFCDIAYHLNATNSTVIAHPIATPLNDGQWYDWRIEKRHNSLKVYVNNVLQYSYNGPLFSGGFLSFNARSSGVIVNIDNLKVYDLGKPLTIETAAVRLRWFAESNTTYQVQWSTDHNTWSNLTSVLGKGAETNIVDWTDGPWKFYRLMMP